MSAPEELLVARLKAHTGVAAITAAIKPCMLTAIDDVPGVVYRLVDTNFENTSTGATETAHGTFEIAAIAADYTAAKALAKQVRLALSGWSDASGQVWHVENMRDESLAPEAGEEGPILYQIILSFQVSYALEES